MIQYENKISLCTITFSFSKLNSYHLNRNHMKRRHSDCDITSRRTAIAARKKPKKSFKRGTPGFGGKIDKLRAMSLPGSSLEQVFI